MQIPEDPGIDFFELLESRGIRPIAHVPAGWLSVSAPDDVDWSGLGVLRTESLDATDKVSPELDGFESGYLVAEFHPDAGPGEMRAIVSSVGFELFEHPDLPPWQVLVRGSLEQVQILAHWDELAYLFPASDDLVKRRPVVACAGAQVGHLSVGQYVARVGEGWDGPGRNAATVSYYYVTATTKLPAGFVQVEFERALAEWARYVDVQFVPGPSPALPKTLSVLFGTRSHGDPFPFDGPGRVLAHTFYPAPPNPEPVAGDVHFDEDENWGSSNELDFYSVALHELGHALGLAHSDRPGAVMYAYYRRASGLATEDITAIQQLYALRQSSGAPAALAISAGSTISGNVASLSGAVSGGTGEVAVTWTNSRGGSGIAKGGRSWTLSLPLQPGLNAVTVTATDAAGAQVSRLITLQGAAEGAASLDLRITSPAASGIYQTASMALTIAGMSEGASRVSWTNSRGGSGNATGTATWTTAPILLLAGANVITVTAHAADGRQTSRSVEVQCQGRDTTAPAIQIHSPGTTSVATSAPSITFRGTTRDGGGVVEVTWANGNGPAGTASGTAFWTAEPIPLLVGVNQITIRARDAAGNSSWRSVTVTRR